MPLRSPPAPLNRWKFNLITQMTTQLKFIPGRPGNQPGDLAQQCVEYPPAIELPDGSRISLHGYDAACGPRQHKRAAKKLPTLETRNQIGALIAAAPELLELLSWVTRCAKMPAPCGISSYAISDEIMNKARTIVAGLPATP